MTTFTAIVIVIGTVGVFLLIAVLAVKLDADPRDGQATMACIDRMVQVCEDIEAALG